MRNWKWFQEPCYFFSFVFGCLTINTLHHKFITSLWIEFQFKFSYNIDNVLVIPICLPVGVEWNSCCKRWINFKLLGNQIQPFFRPWEDYLSTLSSGYHRTGETPLYRSLLIDSRRGSIRVSFQWNISLLLNKGTCVLQPYFLALPPIPISFTATKHNINFLINWFVLSNMILIPLVMDYINGNCH